MISLNNSLSNDEVISHKESKETAKKEQFNKNSAKSNIIDDEDIFELSLERLMEVTVITSR